MIARAVRRAVFFCVVVCAAGAREQCTPGPFTYDVEASGDAPINSGGQTEPCGPFGCDRCASNDDCGGDLCTAEGFCVSGNQSCQLSRVDSCPEGLVCGFNATAPSFEQGVCRVPGVEALAAGASCDPAAAADPCDGFCLPLPAGGGLCTRGCADGAGCDGDTVCGPLVADADARAAPQLLFCLPRCDVGAPSCAPDLACTPPTDPTCVVSQAACRLVSCDVANGSCSGACTDDGPCDSGTACRPVITDCNGVSLDAGLQSCSVGRDVGASCALTGNACRDGAACLPRPGDQGATCTPQSPTPAADGAACDANANTNACESGAYCAATLTDGGRCMRFCDDGADCGVGEDCVAGNVFGLFDPTTAAAHADVDVCAAICDADAECDPGFVCDRDAGEACAGPGHCLPPEARPTPVCTSNAQCPVEAPVCSQSRCVVAAQACTP